MSETTTSLVSKRRQDKCLINFFLHIRRLVVVVVVVVVFVVAVVVAVFSFEGVKIKLVWKTLSKKKVTFWTRWLEFEIPFDDVTSLSFLKQFLGIICCRLACRVRIRTHNLQFQSLNCVWLLIDYASSSQIFSSLIPRSHQLSNKYWALLDPL